MTTGWATAKSVITINSSSSIGRQPVPGERPRFGSVWTWSGITLMAIAPLDGAAGLWSFLDLRTRDISTWYWLDAAGHIMSGWRCLDAGPE